MVSKGGSKFWSSQMWQHFLTQTKHFDRECINFSYFLLIKIHRYLINLHNLFIPLRDPGLTLGRTFLILKINYNLLPWFFFIIFPKKWISYLNQIERVCFQFLHVCHNYIKISEGMGNSMMKFIVCVQMRMAEAFVLFMEKIRGRSYLKVSIPCFPGVLGERTEKGMMFTRHHSVEK